MRYDDRATRIPVRPLREECIVKTWVSCKNVLHGRIVFKEQILRRKSNFGWLRKTSGIRIFERIVNHPKTHRVLNKEHHRALCAEYMRPNTSNPYLCHLCSPFPPTVSVPFPFAKIVFTTTRTHRLWTHRLWTHRLFMHRLLDKLYWSINPLIYLLQNQPKPSNYKLRRQWRHLRR